MSNMEYDYIKQGDCFDLLKTIPDKSINLIITDPPYWHKKSPGKPYSQRKQYNTESKFANSALYNAEGVMMSSLSDFTDVYIEKMLNHFKRILIKMNVYIFCNDTQLAYYSMWAEKNKYLFSVLVWEKPLSIINKNRFSQNVEYIIRIYEYGTGLNRIDNNEYYNKVKKVKPITGKKKLHPTEKPVDLIKQFIMLSTKENDVILDPFLGSGTTAVASILLNRHFIGYELDNNYFNIAYDRIIETLDKKLKEL